MEDEVKESANVNAHIQASLPIEPLTRKFTVVIRGTADGASTKRRIVREIKESIILDESDVVRFEEPEIIVRRP